MSSPWHLSQKTPKIGTNAYSTYWVYWYCAVQYSTVHALLQLPYNKYLHLKIPDILYCTVVLLLVL